jgi:serine protease AprX
MHVAKKRSISTAKRRRGSKTKKSSQPARGPIVMTAGAVQQARAQVQNKLGSQFASKASDEYCLALARGTARREGAVRGTRAGGGRGAAAVAPSGTCVLELTQDQPPVPARESRGGEVLREAARIVQRETPDRRVGTPQLVRQTRLAPIRDGFYKTIAPLYAEIGRRAGRGGRETMSTRRTLDVCWLNCTIRTIAAARDLAEVVADRLIERIDVPQRLVREMRLCAPLVGAPVFRQRTSKDGAGIVVAVIDGEVDVRHPALAGRVMQKRNMTRESFGFPDGHGTAVAGIIGANDARLTGIAPGVSILNYKVFATDPRLDSDDFDGALAIQQALEDGAHVANCSWGAGPAGDGTGRQARACDGAWGLGMVIVKSAGNAGPSGRTLTTPADSEGVIAVGATDKRGREVQSYSSRGPAGTRSRPHLVAPGGTDASGVETCVPGGTFGSAGAGTSFAAPQVSGLVALLLDDNADLSPDEVREALIRSCVRLAAGDANAQGAGLIKLT